MEFISIAERQYTGRDNNNASNEFYQCETCERYLYSDENIFSYRVYRQKPDQGSFFVHQICLNCLQGQVQKQKWEREKKETIKTWQNHSNNWPGCDALNGMPNDIVAILYDYTQPVPPIELQPEFKVVWPMDANTQNRYNQLQKTNQKSMLVSFLLDGGTAVIILLVVSPKKRNRNAPKQKHKKRKLCRK